MGGNAPVTQPTQTNKKELPQLFLVAANAFSIFYAVEAGVIAVVLGIKALTTGGAAGAVLAYMPFWFGFSAVIFGLIALLTTKKITDQELLRKAYGVVAAFLLIEAVLAVAAAVAAMLYALFALGTSSSIQQAMWLNVFLPALGIAAGATLFAFIAKKIYDGQTKLISILSYVILGVAGLALILTIIAIFTGLYGGRSGGSGSRYYYY